MAGQIFVFILNEIHKLDDTECNYKEHLKVTNSV